MRRIVVLGYGMCVLEVEHAGAWVNRPRDNVRQKRKNVIILMHDVGLPIIYPKGPVMDRIITWGTFFLVLIVGLGFVA